MKLVYSFEGGLVRISNFEDSLTLELLSALSDAVGLSGLSMLARATINEF